MATQTPKYVLFILSNAREIGPRKRACGNYFPEVAHPYQELVRHGCMIDFATIEGGEPPMDGYDAKDADSQAFHDSGGFRRLRNSRALAEIDVDAYDAIFFPGGLGPMVDFAATPIIKQTIARAYDHGKVVAAVCHGPVALLDVTLASGELLLRGRQVASFTVEEERGYAIEDVPFVLQTAIERQGAHHSGVAPWQPHVVVDGRLVTGQNPASATGVGRAMMQVMTQPG
jgi:putative intracellular protease/amidase